MEALRAILAAIEGVEIPSVGEILNIWWGVPSALWILGITEGIRRWTPVPSSVSWLVHIALGIVGAVLWTKYGPPPAAESVMGEGQCLPQGVPQRDLATEIALGVRAAVLASGLFLTGGEMFDRITGKRNGHAQSDEP